jgi:hypothetical protein
MMFMQPEPEEAVEEDDGGEKEAAEEDEDADAYGGYREDEEPGRGEGGEDGDGEEAAEDDGMPDSPTGTYKPGGLGVGSHFFNADDLKCVPFCVCHLSAR